MIQTDFISHRDANEGTWIMLCEKGSCSHVMSWFRSKLEPFLWSWRGLARWGQCDLAAETFSSAAAQWYTTDGVAVFSASSDCCMRSCRMCWESL